MNCDVLDFPLRYECAIVCFFFNSRELDSANIINYQCGYFFVSGEHGVSRKLRKASCQEIISILLMLL